MTINQLESLTIYEIREIARRAGIVPGTRRKNEIIDDIIAVSEGKLVPNLEKRYGRPPKSLGLGDYFMTLQYQDYISKKGDVSLKQPPIQFKFGEVLEVTGYFELKDNKTGLLWEYDNFHYNKYVMPPPLIERYKLKQGDKLFALASATAEKSIVKDIFNINDEKVTAQPNYIDYEATQHNSPNKAIKNNLKLNLKFGETYFVKSENSAETTTALIDLLKNCKADYKLYINPSVAEKNKAIISELPKDVETFLSYLSDSSSTAKDLSNLAIGRAKRIFESGKNCVVVIDDIGAISALSPDDDLIARNLLNLTKSCEQGAITILASIIENKYNSHYFKFADKIFTVQDNHIV